MSRSTKRNSIDDNILRALEHFGIEAREVHLIQDLVNRSYRIHGNDKCYYLRHYNSQRHNSNTIRSECEFLLSASRAGVDCPRPVIGHGGDPLFESHDTSGDPLRIAVFGWIEGVILEKDKRLEHFHLLGEQLGRLHRHAMDWKIPESFQRPKISIVDIFEACERNVREMGQSKALLQNLEIANELWSKLESNLTPESHGLVHGDPSFGNVLFHDNGAKLIDFDDMGHGYFAYDLAVVLAGAWEKPHFEDNRKALLQAYQEQRTMSEIEYQSLPLFMAARAASLISWCLKQSEQHPWIEGQSQRIQDYLSNRELIATAVS